MMTKIALSTFCVFFMFSSLFGQEQCWKEQRKVYSYNDVNKVLYTKSDPTSFLSTVHKFAKDTAQNVGAIKGVDKTLNEASQNVAGINLYNNPDFRIIQIKPKSPLVDIYGDDSISIDGLYVYPYLAIEYLANHECDIEVTEYYDLTDSTWKIKEVAFYYFFGFRLQKQPTMTINWEKFRTYCKKEGIAARWFESNRLYFNTVHKTPCNLFSSNTISSLTVKKPPYLSIRSTFLEAEKVKDLYVGGDDLVFSIYDFIRNNDLLLYPEQNIEKEIYVEHFNSGVFADNPLIKNDLFFYFGYLGPSSDIPMVNIFGGDSINNKGDAVYPARDSIYFKEKHIEQFRVIELGMYNPETKEINYQPLSWSIICKDENGKYGSPYWININSFFYKLIEEHPSLENWKTIVQKTTEEGAVYQLWEIKER